jgi:hypothetical protein
MQITLLNPTDSTASSPSKSLNSFRLVLAHSQLVLLCKSPKTCPIVLHVDPCLLSHFSKHIVSYVFGLLILAAQTPVIIDKTPIMTDFWLVIIA